MLARRRNGRPVNGIIVIDKPKGLSSNDVVQKAKRLYGARKVGHTGSLDPLATGVLPLCFGEATKFSQFLLASDKKYWVRIKLGVATETGDADGDVISRSEASHITRQDIDRVLVAFRGEIQQVPSMYSALKHNGQPLYKLARQGIEVPRTARFVQIYSNEVVGYEQAQIELEIHCTKGTYIRTIAEDIGNALKVGAHVTELRRRSAGPFTENDLITIEFLEKERENGSLDRFLMPTASAVGEWPEVRLSDATSFYLKQGQPVQVSHAPSSGWVRLSENDGQEVNFLGVGEVLDDGRVAPRRLVVN